MDIERGDNRQYFENYVPKEDISGQVAGALYQGMQSGVSITQKANEADLASKQIDLSTRFLAENNRINTKYQADPTNPQRETEIKQAFENLSSQYKINPLCQKQWTNIKTNVFDRYKEYNSQWIEKQQLTNAQINLKDGYNKLINQAFSMGENNSSIDDVRLIYANGNEAIRNGATPQLGEVATGEALKNVGHDFMSMYLSGLMQTDPAKALQLLNDKNSGVENDINDGDTMMKLKQSAQAKLLKKTEVDAVDRIANFVNNNTQLFNKAFDGTITTAEAQTLLQNKNVDRQMRHILSDMLGYSSGSDYSVNIDTGKIEKAEKKSRGSNGGNSDSGEYGGSSGTVAAGQDPTYAELVIGDKKWTFINSKGKVRKASTQEKQEISSELYLQGSRILNGIQNKTPQQAMRQVAQFQSQIAQARYFGIDKGDYNNLMNNFVLPATQNIQDEAKDYNSRGPKNRFHQYGYNQIEDYFKKNFDGKTEENRKERDREQALASVYYWSSLNNYCSQKGIKMSDLKNLSGEKKASIYSNAAKKAINLARSNSSNPQLWFRSANPQYVSTIRSLLPNKQANDVITNIAVSAMSNPTMSDKDFNSLINRELQKEYAKLRTSNKSIVFGKNHTKYDEYINQYAMLNHVDPLLIKAIIKHESGFNEKASSGKGAGGLMQLMPSTARGFGVKNLYDPKQNIMAGTKYFANLLNKYKGNIPLALAAYNAGAGAVKKYGNKIPPYKETQNYVKSIMATYKKARG